MRSGVVDLLVGVEIGVQGAFGVDDQLAPARQAHDHVGAQAAVLGVDRNLGLIIGIGREASLLEHVLQALLAPAPARLGAGAQSIDEVAGLVADLAVAGMEQSHRLAQRLVAPHPLLLDFAQPFLIALQRRLDRLEQGLELGIALLARLVEAGVGPFEELLLRLAQQFGADLVELGGERFLGLDHLLHPRLEIAGVGLERSEIAHRPVALGGHGLGSVVRIWSAALARSSSAPVRPRAANQPKATAAASRAAARRRVRGSMRALSCGTKSEPRAGAGVAQPTFVTPAKAGVSWRQP